MTRHGQQRQVEAGAPPSIPSQSIEASGQEATLAYIPPTRPEAGAIRVSAVDLHTEGRMSQCIADFLRQHPGADSFTIGRGNTSTIITDPSIPTISRSHLAVRFGAHDALYVTNTGTQDQNAYYQNPEDPIKTHLPKDVEIKLRPDSLIFLGEAKSFVIDPADRWRSLARPGHLDLTEARMGLADPYLDNGLREALQKEGGKIIIGRLPASLPSIDSGLSKISVEHVRIMRITGGYMVTDLSEKGTWLSADGGKTYLRLPKGQAIEVSSASLVLGGCKKCNLPAVAAPEPEVPIKGFSPLPMHFSDPAVVHSKIFAGLAESRRILSCGREFYSVPLLGEREAPKDIVVFYPDVSRFSAELTPTKAGFIIKANAWEVRNVSSAAILVHDEKGKVKIIEPKEKADVAMGSELFLSGKAHAIKLPHYSMK